MIEVNNVKKSFGKTKVLKDVSLKVDDGDVVVVLGPSGSGKTTLMNMISGIYYPDEGQVFINGQEVQIRSPQDAFNQHIGMIHQHFKLVDVFTAADNIILGDKLVKVDNRKILNGYFDNFK